MAAAPKSMKKKSYHHNDLRNAIVKTSLKFLLKRKGPNFSLREVANELGVTHVSVYRHFSGKQALIDNLTAEGFRQLRQYQTKELEKAPSDAMSQLNALGTAYILFAKENPGFFALMFGQDREDETPESGREKYNAEALSTLIGVIERCQKEGIIIQGDPRRLALYLVLAPHGYACYSPADLAFISPSDTIQQAEVMAELSVISVMCNPPSPEEISRLYFQ
ncbi:TetR/AcrR family transcriptional regulator [Rhizobium sp. L1K21]|uniref:TetR/AcrR family transcriptional regulator n=1 Tax=Rhizobium sp. L1K21 TaxID=2954933 RepID=UPI002092DAEA|nr:TetR/AcrR family transcriptional regulator [Rhizobium sp. L1K21]MCO6188591.1 TetR/AcrR family transcriptional regulator [Rhizobium sp. L1K21]